MLHTRKRLHAAPGIIILDVMTGDPDTQTVERVRDGETFLYEVLVRRYNQRLYRVARAFLHDEAEVEDVMQEAYLKAFTGLPRFQGKALFSTWLTRILINCALASLRRANGIQRVDQVLGRHSPRCLADPVAVAALDIDDAVSCHRAICYRF